MTKWRFIGTLFLIIIISGCSTAPKETPVLQASTTETAIPQPTDTLVAPSDTPLPPTEAPISTDTQVPPTDTPTTVPTLAPPAAEPQVIEFSSEDGLQLAGTFYPASINPAPVVVLMHEGLGNQSQVEALALWMQNRPDEVDAGPTGLTVYDWMPEFPPEIGSLAVFTFDMRGHGKSEGPLPPPGQPLPYLMDARAALALAKTLEGVDPHQVVPIGASMFAEAGLLGCLSLEGTTILPEQTGNDCIATLAISPFGFYNIPFDQAADALFNAVDRSTVWCLHAEQDINPETCRAIDGKDRARAVIYPGDTHGVEFFQPGLDPEFGQILVEFLRTVFAESMP